MIADSPNLVCGSDFQIPFFASDAIIDGEARPVWLLPWAGRDYWGLGVDAGTGDVVALIEPLCDSTNHRHDSGASGSESGEAEPEYIVGKNWNSSTSTDMSAGHLVLSPGRFSIEMTAGVKSGVERSTMRFAWY